MRTLVPSVSRPRRSSWYEGLDLTLAILRLAKCPPELVGEVEGDLIARKARRDRRTMNPLGDAQRNRRS